MTWATPSGLALRRSGAKRSPANAAGDEFVGREVIDVRAAPRHGAGDGAQDRLRFCRGDQHMLARSGGGERHRRNGEQELVKRGGEIAWDFTLALVVFTMSFVTTFLKSTADI